MREILKKNIVEVIFTKKNGEKRTMLCTTHPDYLPSTEGSASGGYEGIITVFDLENDGWRSFREDSVISHRIISAVTGEE